MRAILLALLLLAPQTLMAQDAGFRVSMVSAVSAHGADLATTEFCLGAQKCHEINPFLRTFTSNPGVFGSVKMGIAGLQLWGMAKLHDSHPKIATTLNFVTTGLYFVIAVHNGKAIK